MQYWITISDHTHTQSHTQRERQTDRHTHTHTHTGSNTHHSSSTLVESIPSSPFLYSLNLGFSQSQCKRCIGGCGGESYFMRVWVLLSPRFLWLRGSKSCDHFGRVLVGARFFCNSEILVADSDMVVRLPGFLIGSLIVTYMVTNIVVVVLNPTQTGGGSKVPTALHLVPVYQHR